MTVATVVDAVVVHVAAMTGIKKVYGDPPDSINLFPSAIVYARSGHLGTRQGRGVCTRAEHVVIVEVHHSRQLLPKAVSDAQAWPDLLAAQLWASTTIEVQSATWVAGALQYNNETHYGIRFEITVRD